MTNPCKLFKQNKPRGQLGTIIGKKGTALPLLNTSVKRRNLQQNSWLKNNPTDEEISENMKVD